MTPAPGNGLPPPDMPDLDDAIRACLLATDGHAPFATVHLLARDIACLLDAMGIHAALHRYDM